MRRRGMRRVSDHDHPAAVPGRRQKYGCGVTTRGPETERPTDMWDKRRSQIPNQSAVHLRGR
jgi:hypothetical protein